MIPNDQFLASTEVVDWKRPIVQSLARELAVGTDDPEGIAKRCFEWVRDEIKHSRDFSLRQVTCSASEVIEHGSGYCYAKSHLLAALMRANGIPAGFCYQRLSRDDNGFPFCLHGLNAVFLPQYGWYRLDARGNRDGIDARFCPPEEHLAFSSSMRGEADLFDILPEPLPIVIESLRKHNHAQDLWESLPDASVTDIDRVIG